MRCQRARMQLQLVIRDTPDTLGPASWGCQRRGRLGWDLGAAPACFAFIPRFHELSIDEVGEGARW
jgi:hypothetical protein